MGTRAESRGLGSDVSYPWATANAGQRIIAFVLHALVELTDIVSPHRWQHLQSIRRPRPTKEGSYGYCTDRYSFIAVVRRRRRTVLGTGRRMGHWPDWVDHRGTGGRLPLEQQ